MSYTVYFDSAEYKRMQREQRIHVMPSARGASAVHLVFAGHSLVVQRGRLSASLAEARRLVHRLMEQHDASETERFNAGLPVFDSHATLQPVTAQQVRAMRNARMPLDPAQLRAIYDLIVQTCYEAILDCDDPRVRMQAAHILQSVGFMPRRGCEGTG